MTKITKIALSIALIGGLAACAAPAEETALEATASTKTFEPMATVKPGASVTLKSVLPKAMTSGTFQTVKLRMEDQYADGTLSVKIEPSSGLKLFGGASSKTFDMAKPGAHEWDVDVKADTDGVYFLNVFATANGMPRSFSVRLDVGTVTQKMFDEAMPADGELTDGGKIRALEVTETIE